MKEKIQTLKGVIESITLNIGDNILCDDDNNSYRKTLNKLYSVRNKNKNDIKSSVNLSMLIDIIFSKNYFSSSEQYFTNTDFGNTFFIQYFTSHEITIGGYSVNNIRTKIEVLNELLLEYNFNKISFNLRSINGSKITNIIKVFRELDWIPVDFERDRLILKKEV